MTKGTTPIMDRFISDPHLGHENIIKVERTQFTSIKEHDDYIKNLIMTEVKTYDTLYVLGDVGELTKENISFWKNVPGKKILIRGNHDTQKGRLEDAFDNVSNVPIFYNKRILLSHEPLPVTNETINVHGHLHGAYLDSKNHLNLSIHMANYKIFTEKDLEVILRQMPKISQKFLYEWYADKYVFTTEKNDVIYDKEGKLNLQQSRIVQFANPQMTRTINAFVKQLRTNHPTLSETTCQKAVKEFLLSDYENCANPQPKDLEKYL